MELRNLELMVTTKINPQINLPVIPRYHLHVVLLIYWNQNDPELCLLALIFGNNPQASMLELLVTARVFY